jgi:hypothetical protein
LFSDPSGGGRTQSGFRLLTPALSSFEEEREKMSQAAVLVLVY